MSSIPAAKDRLSHLGKFIYSALPARLAWVHEDVETILAELSRLEEENATLRGSADEHDLFDAETDAAFKDLDATIDDLRKENAKLRAERDEALEQVAAYRAGCVRVFNNLCPKCRGHAQLPEKALDPDWAASLKGGADV